MRLVVEASRLLSHSPLPASNIAAPGGDVSGFLQSFSGSHHFVLDYLMEEVFTQQPDHIKRFLLQTSILDRLSGPLCDAVCLGETVAAGLGEDGQGTLWRVRHGEGG